ncbi:IS3 family transposase [uncultured Senegalimassilia sp.]|uniref:IS3 family transposase n=1 Tax=uncultured Senegalimassilia sp. TaxID=1714350 RepID=UPI00338DC8A4
MHRQRRDRAGFRAFEGHFRGREWPDFESFKADPDAYVTYWNTQRRQVKLKGLTPEEFRNQSLAA